MRVNFIFQLVKFDQSGLRNLFRFDLDSRYTGLPTMDETVKTTSNFSNKVFCLECDFIKWHIIKLLGKAIK